MTMFFSGMSLWRQRGGVALACVLLVPAASVTSAQTKATTQAKPAADAKGKGDHKGHHHEAPHGGTLTEIGDHFAFLELVHDEATGTLTLYVLDGSAEKAVRVTHPTLTFRLERTGGAAQPIELKARARALTGETVGDTSEFVGTSDLLKGLKAGRGTLAEIVIKGQTLKDLAIKWPDGN
jgi:hypothetical protein